MGSMDSHVRVDKTGIVFLDDFLTWKSQNTVRCMLEGKTNIHQHMYGLEGPISWKKAVCRLLYCPVASLFVGVLQPWKYKTQKQMHERFAPMCSWQKLVCAYVLLTKIGSNKIPCNPETPCTSAWESGLLSSLKRGLELPVPVVGIFLLNHGTSIQKMSMVHQPTDDLLCAVSEYRPASPWIRPPREGHDTCCMQPESSTVPTNSLYIWLQMQTCKRTYSTHKRFLYKCNTGHIQASCFQRMFSCCWTQMVGASAHLHQIQPIFLAHLSKILDDMGKHTLERQRIINSKKICQVAEHQG